jgi:hypothetical protein
VAIAHHPRGAQAAPHTKADVELLDWLAAGRMGLCMHQHIAARLEPGVVGLEDQPALAGLALEHIGIEQGQLRIREARVLLALGGNAVGRFGLGHEEALALGVGAHVGVEHEAAAVDDLHGGS